MNKSFMWFIVTVVIIGIMGLVFYVIQNDSDTNTNVNIVETTNSAVNVNTEVSDSENININENVSDTASSQVGATTRVAVIESGFVPETVTIEAGGTVTWKNDSSQTVYVAPDDHPSHLKYVGIWDDDGTGSIAPGEEYSFLFTKSGTYTYHDHLNATDTGTVIVE